MIEHVDRVPKYPGRVSLIPVPGQPNKYDMERDDDPTNPGTPQNKKLFDELLAASGTTSGAKDALILDQPGFVLFDGATIRVRLHVTPAAKVYLNVSSTGAKRILSATGENIEGLKEGAYLSVTYSSAWDAYVATSSGCGAVALSKSINILEELDNMKYLQILDNRSTGVQFPWLMNYPAQAYGKTALNGWDVLARATFGMGAVQVRIIKPGNIISDYTFDAASVMYTPGSITSCKIQILPVHFSNHFLVRQSWSSTSDYSSQTGCWVFFNSTNNTFTRVTTFGTNAAYGGYSDNPSGYWAPVETSSTAVLATDGYVYFTYGTSTGGGNISMTYFAFSPSNATGGSSISPAASSTVNAVLAPLRGGGLMSFTSTNCLKYAPWNGSSSSLTYGSNLGVPTSRDDNTYGGGAFVYETTGVLHATYTTTANVSKVVTTWNLSTSQSTMPSGQSFNNIQAIQSHWAFQIGITNKLVSMNAMSPFGGQIGTWDTGSVANNNVVTTINTPSSIGQTRYMTVGSGQPNFIEGYAGWQGMCLTYTTLYLLKNGVVYSYNLPELINATVPEPADGVWTCPEDGLYKIIAVGGGAAGGTSFAGGSGYMTIAVKEFVQGETVEWRLGRGQLSTSAAPGASLPSPSVFGDIIGPPASSNVGGFNGGTTANAGGGGGYDLQIYGGKGMNYVAPTTATNVTTLISMNKDRNGGLSSNSGAVSSGDGYGAGGGASQPGSDGVIVIMR